MVAAVSAGRLLTTTAQSDLETIRANETSIVSEPSDEDTKVPEEQAGATTEQNAQYNLGRVAAIMALLDDSKRSQAGFRSE
ncbi:hypothetical protein A3F65_01370 [Candidatus Saccharibacteria bacterium RIFCSPHIGHO2_12_FULL_47_16b]|nr:MAG: hypothetical protein A3F65_01370 [Candidatus Saccharibacteria bacterium RIFCSPHIGHO2_12_FULL_47_16b]